MANHLSFDMLSRLAESRTSMAEEPRARRHLTSCARCRSELEWLQRIQGAPGRSGGFEVGWVNPGGGAADADDDEPFAPPGPRASLVNPQSTTQRRFSL